jgi:hypothetical protein
MLKPQMPNMNAKMFKAAKNWYNLSDFYRNNKYTQGPENNSKLRKEEFTFFSRNSAWSSTFMMTIKTNWNTGAW